MYYLVPTEGVYYLVPIPALRHREDLGKISVGSSLTWGDKGNAEGFTASGRVVKRAAGKISSVGPSLKGGHSGLWVLSLVKTKGKCTRVNTSILAVRRRRSGDLMH